MLDFFTIFSKGGIVLWCFQGTVGSFTFHVNELIKNVILQERSGNQSFTHEQLALKYKLDNEFELVFVVGFQKILQLSYIDRLLTDIQRQFRDKYKNALERHSFGTYDFDSDFMTTLKEVEYQSRTEKAIMRTFDKSKKGIEKQTNKSLISNGEEKKVVSKKQTQKEKKQNQPAVPAPETVAAPVAVKAVEVAESAEVNEQAEVERRRALLLSGKFKPRQRKDKPAEKSNNASAASPKKTKGKIMTKWDNGGTSKDTAVLDYSSADTANGIATEQGVVVSDSVKSMVGQLGGDLKPVECDENNSEDASDEEEEVDPALIPTKPNDAAQKKDDTPAATASKPSGGGLFSFFKGLAGHKAITKEAVTPVLDKMKEHLCAKNVAADIAEQLCKSVAEKLEGKVLGTFSGVTSAVKTSMEETLVQILSPKRRIDVLRDIQEGKRKGRPYVIVFCGVNGVGKSTNLAKICFWLLENQHRVMIAACDTFRSGAVEQLRTHTLHLNSLHPKKSEKEPDKVTLYNRGYGKDAAAVAMEAINFAREQAIDVVLVDTAGRMQDNEPLMRSLAKLIKLNDPNLVLFVGEALVGNDGVDQLRKFNQALADHSDVANPHLIDGIVLTKFDTIDDKVGAAISMTYTTGQPIVFVGTGQTYTDLRSLNVKAVVQALLKK